MVTILLTWGPDHEGDARFVDASHAAGRRDSCGSITEGSNVQPTMGRR